MKTILLSAAFAVALAATGAYAQSAGVTSGASGAASTDTVGTGIAGSASQGPAEVNGGDKTATGAPTILVPPSIQANAAGNAALGGNNASMGGGGSVGPASSASTP